jgi:nucleoid-associated protein YgaU
LYFQRRLFVGAIVSVLLISGIGGAHALFGATPARAAIPATYVVKGGDTLWKVAQGLGVEGDVRDAIEVIAAANGGPALQPGQVLVIPESLRS